MSVLNGTDLILMVDTGSGNVPVAHATSHSISLEVETRDISSKSSGVWADAEAGRISWSGSVDGLVSYDAAFGYAELFDLVVARTKVKVVSAIFDGNETDKVKDDTYVVFGDVILTSLEKTSPDNDNVTFSLSFTGAGALTKEKSAVE
jgi:TP901-1 family phage major tail protein